MPRLVKVAASSVFSLSNFFFLGEQGYFDADAVLKPLLHTWSLGVEEQFYLLWPILLFLLYKWKTNSTFIFISFFIFIFIFISIALAYFYQETHPNMVFFMLPFRMFEFLLGVIALRIEQNARDLEASSRKAIISVGLVLIFFSILWSSDSTFQSLQFSSVNGFGLLTQILCCVGTMLIIAYGLSEQNLLSSLFFDKLLTVIGLSSYSIYLMHWPLIVFYKMYRIEELLAWEKAMLFTLSIILGFLVWKYVENTFRYKDKEKGILRFKYIIPVGLLFLAGLGSFLFSQSSTVEHEEEKINTEISVGKAKQLNEADLEAEMKRYWKDAEPNSPILKGTNNKKVVVMGNSHAVDLIYAFKKNGMQAEIISMPSTHLCYHFGSQAILPKDAKKCLQIKNRHLKNKNWAEVDAVFLHDHWPVEETTKLSKFVLELRAKTKAPIYVFGPKMVFKSTIPQLVKASGTDDPSAINAFAVRFSDLKNRIHYDEQLDQLFDSNNMKKQNIHYVSLLGDAGLKEIISTQNNDYYYFDKSHLTEKGAIELGRGIKQEYPYLFEF